MVQLLAWHRGKTLNTFLSKFPTKTFDSDDEYTWDVIGSSDRNIPLVEARDENGQTVTTSGANIGIAGAPFYLVFAKDWFALGEVIVGDLNEIYPMRILGDPKIEGTNAVYCVELMGGNINVESTYGEGSNFVFSVPQKIKLMEEPDLTRTQR